MTLAVLNNSLPWDGSHLGSVPDEATVKWLYEGTEYCTIHIPQGIIYCIARRSPDLFSCIVEEAKSIFGLPKTGFLRVRIGSYEHTIYKVPVTDNGQVFWEPSLDRLGATHPLRLDDNFRRDVQKLLIFCDIMSLTSTRDSSIRVRIQPPDRYIPININEINTTLRKKIDYDFTILTKKIMLEWFGENANVYDILRDMIIQMEGPITTNNLTVVCHNIRIRLDIIINKYDKKYIWYSTFIIDRLSRYLLQSIK
jgi:hypothetical protein